MKEKKKTLEKTLQFLFEPCEYMRICSTTIYKFEFVLLCVPSVPDAVAANISELFRLHTARCTNKFNFIDLNCMYCGIAIFFRLARSHALNH